MIVFNIWKKHQIELDFNLNYVMEIRLKDSRSSQQTEILILNFLE